MENVINIYVYYKIESYEKTDRQNLKGLNFNENLQFQFYSNLENGSQKYYTFESKPVQKETKWYHLHSVHLINCFILINKIFVQKNICPNELSKGITIR